METNTSKVKWVLCSTKFDDIVHIAPKELNTISIQTNYQKTSVKNMKRAYYNYARSTQKKIMNEHNDACNLT